MVTPAAVNAVNAAQGIGCGCVGQEPDTAHHMGPVSSVQPTCLTM